MFWETELNMLIIHFWNALNCRHLDVGKNPLHSSLIFLTSFLLRYDCSMNNNHHPYTYIKKWQNHKILRLHWNADVSDF